MPEVYPKEVVAMDVWMWGLIAAVAVAAAGAWLKRRARRVRVLDRIRVEVHPARVVDDRVVEQVWRSAISMTNQSRRPRVVPTFAERATVRAGWREYLANVYRDADQVEINPREVALAWIEYVLPANGVPGRIRVLQLASEREPRALLFAPREVGSPATQGQSSVS